MQALLVDNVLVLSYNSVNAQGNLKSDLHQFRHWMLSLGIDHGVDMSSDAESLDL